MDVTDDTGPFPGLIGPMRACKPHVQSVIDWPCRWLEEGQTVPVPGTACLHLGTRAPLNERTCIDVRTNADMPAAN